MNQSAFTFRRRPSGLIFPVLDDNDQGLYNFSFGSAANQFGPEISKAKHLPPDAELLVLAALRYLYTTDGLVTPTYNNKFYTIFSGETVPLPYPLRVSSPGVKFAGGNGESTLIKVISDGYTNQGHIANGASVVTAGGNSCISCHCAARTWTHTGDTNWWEAFRLDLGAVLTVARACPIMGVGIDGGVTGSIRFSYSEDGSSWTDSAQHDNTAIGLAQSPVAPFEGVSARYFKIDIKTSDAGRTVTGTLYWFPVWVAN